MAIPLSVAKELLRRDMKKSEQQHKNACDTGEHRGVLLAQFTYINWLEWEQEARGFTSVNRAKQKYKSACNYLFRQGLILGRSGCALHKLGSGVS